MAQRVLILNLGDETGGPAEQFFLNRTDRKAQAKETLSRQKATLAAADKARLKIVAKAEIEHFDAVGAFKDYVAGNTGTKDFKALAKLVGKATKIMVVAHGGVVNVSSLSYKNADGAAFDMPVDQLAGFFKALIVKPGKDHFFALLSCFGARVPERLDQQSGMTDAELASTLSFRFLKELSTSLTSVTVTARPGKVSVSRYSNGVESSTDAAADVDEQFALFVASDTYQTARKAFIARFGTPDLPKICPTTPKTKLDELRIIQDYNGKLYGEAKFLDEDEVKIACAYYTLRSKAEAMPKGNDFRHKHGKFIYRWSGGILTILNRYADPTGAPGQIASDVRKKAYDGLVLYRGPML